MDTRTGKIIMPEEVKKMFADMPMEEHPYIKMMNASPTKAQMARKPPRVGGNDLCPCGSGKKFKKCCMTPPIPKREE